MMLIKHIMIKQLKTVRYLCPNSVNLVIDKLDSHNGRLGTAENTMVLLKAMGGSNGEGGSGADMLDALHIMVENLRKECYASFGSRSDSDLMKRKIDEI